jgi:hypothetical protein
MRTAIVALRSLGTSKTIAVDTDQGIATTCSSGIALIHTTLDAVLNIIQQIPGNATLLLEVGLES